MNTSTTIRPFNFVQVIRKKPGWLFGFLILMALIFFEMFNYSTTDYALKDLLGELKFFGMPWATILAVAFCGIDFAGIARLFTPEEGLAEKKEVWYLLGAWMLAATMNALLTWWGVSMAIANHALKSSAVVDAGVLNKAVPIFVALMVWVIRILIIGTLSIAGERIFSTRTEKEVIYSSRSSTKFQSADRPTMTRPVMQTRRETPGQVRAEPTYHSLSAGGRNTPPRPGGINDPRR